jgi:uncharacterized glyoxalase superfamily protein PhnB
MKPAFQFHSTVPVVSTNDVVKSVAYYTSVLGFSPDFEFGNPVVYAGVKIGEAEIYFAHDPAILNLRSEKDFKPEIFVWLSDVDESFKQHVANGAEIIEPPLDRPWGLRQYVIRDINGYHLKFAQPL